MVLAVRKPAEYIISQYHTTINLQQIKSLSPSLVSALDHIRVSTVHTNGLGKADVSAWFLFIQYLLGSVYAH